MSFCFRGLVHSCLKVGGGEWVAHEILGTVQSLNSPFHFILDLELGTYRVGLVNLIIVCVVSCVAFKVSRRFKMSKRWYRIKVARKIPNSSLRLQVWCKNCCMSFELNLVKHKQKCKKKLQIVLVLWAPLRGAEGKLPKSNMHLCKPGDINQQTRVSWWILSLRTNPGVSCKFGGWSRQKKPGGFLQIVCLS